MAQKIRRPEDGSRQKAGHYRHPSPAHPLGLGGGNAVSKKLGASDFKPDRVIVFNDDRETPVKMVGNNSGYLFYIEKGKDFVTVSPVNAVRKIQKTAK
jgi:hypothetical protein